MLLQLVNFTDTQLRGIWNCLQTTYNELLSKSYQKKKKSLPLSVEYSTDNSRLDSLINSYLHYRYSHAYLHHNDVLRRNARVHDGCNALPDYSSGFRLYNSSLLRLHFHLHHQTTGFLLAKIQYSSICGYLFTTASKNFTSRPDDAPVMTAISAIFPPKFWCMDFYTVHVCQFFHCRS